MMVTMNDKVSRHALKPSANCLPNVQGTHISLWLYICHIKQLTGLTRRVNPLGLAASLDQPVDQANSAFHPSGVGNEDQLRMGRYRQVWFIIHIALFYQYTGSIIDNNNTIYSSILYYMFEDERVGGR